MHITRNKFVTLEKKRDLQNAMPKSPFLHPDWPRWPPPETRLDVCNAIFPRLPEVERYMGGLVPG